MDDSQWDFVTFEFQADFIQTGYIVMELLFKTFGSNVYQRFLANGKQDQ